MTTHLDVQALTIAVGTAIPFLTSLLMKQHAPSWLKAVGNAFLAAVAGGLVTAIGDHGNVVLGSWVVGIAEGFGASVASYFGIWKPAGVTDAISRKSSSIGFGPVAPKATFSSQLPAGEDATSTTIVAKVPGAASIDIGKGSNAMYGSPYAEQVLDDMLEAEAALAVPVAPSVPPTSGATPMSPWLLSEADRLLAEVEALLVGITSATGATPIADALRTELNALLHSFNLEFDRLGTEVDKELVAARERVTVAADKLDSFIKSHI